MTARRPTLAGARILLGVTGGVAAYKAPELTRALAKEGAHVSVLLTKYARRFVTRDALRAVTRGPVLTGLFEPQALTSGPWFEGSAPSPLGMAHIGMAREADLVLVAPATANALGKLAHGLADDLLSTALIATRSPVLIAPAMNVAMWEHAAVRENVRILAGRGVRFVGPEEGELADGEVGMGRMASIDSIVAACGDALRGRGTSSRGGMNARLPATPQAGEAGRGPEPEALRSSPRATMELRGLTIVVTAGGTEEAIDPVRVITNRSSGKMGFAVAEAARDMGATVRLIVAHTSAPAPAGIDTIEAMSSREMAKAVLREMKSADALVMAAAVSDYAPAKTSARKIAREAGGLTLRLRATEDILKAVRARYPRKYLAGFALETEDELRRGREKLKRKGLDLVAVNNPLKRGSAFGSDQNEVTLIDKTGKKIDLGLRPKQEVAREILERIAKSLSR